MPVNARQEPDDAALATALVTAFAAAGKTKPMLPAHERDDVIALLIGVMADRERLAAYTAALEAEQERQGVRDLLLTQPGLEIPDAQIAEEGFSGLADDQLADIALCPEALFAIREYLDEPDTVCGDWLINKILEVEAARPDAADRDRRAREIYEALRDAGLLSLRKPETISEARPEGRRSGRFRPLRRFGFRLLPIAASLIVGLGLGRLAFRGEGSGKIEVLLASVTPKFGTTRGAEQSLFVDVASVRPGFATLVTLAPHRPQQVFPEPGDRPLRAEPSAPHSYGPLPRDSTAVLVLITDTPATDKLVRDALLSQEFKPADLDRLRSYLQTLLAQAGYRWVAMSFSLLTPRQSR